MNSASSWCIGSFLYLFSRRLGGAGFAGARQGGALLDSQPVRAIREP
jgi:hypothetical protein